MASFNVSRDFPVPAADLYAAATSPDYLRVRGERFGGVGGPRLTTEGKTLTIATARRLPIDKVPSAARKFLPGDGTLQQADEWHDRDGSWAGTWVVSGTPAKVAGEHSITTAGDGSRYTVKGEASLSVPIVGGKIANEIAKRIEELVGHEFDLLSDYLKR